MMALLQVMYEADMRKLLPKITCPALLVVGEHDFR
jgi:pimeloyl-ACP methyl ester carboxylesterase